MNVDIKLSAIRFHTFLDNEKSAKVEKRLARSKNYDPYRKI